MASLQAASGAIFLLVMVVLGMRLLFLAWRNRTLPELLLGLAFLFGGAFGAAIEAGAAGVTDRPEVAGSLIAVGKSFALLGMLANCAFTWWVFRRDDPRGLVLIAVVMGLQVTAFAGHASSGAFETAVMRPLWFWIELLGRVASPAWLGTESFLYWRAMQRRVRIGLADPVVANRFLLWAIASATGILCLFTSIPPLYMSEESLLLQADLFIFAAFGLATAAAYWLAFFPTRGYKRWVEASAQTV